MTLYRSGSSRIDGHPAHEEARSTSPLRKGHQQRAFRSLQPLDQALAQESLSGPVLFTLQPYANALPYFAKIGSIVANSSNRSPSLKSPQS